MTKNRLAAGVGAAGITLMLAFCFTAGSRAKTITRPSSAGRILSRARIVSAPVSMSLLRFDENVDLGTLPGNTKLSASIPICNLSDHVVRLAFSSSSCGCVSGKSGLVLNDKAEFAIPITVHTSSGGKFSKQITYKVSGDPAHDQITFQITGTISAPLLPRSVSIRDAVPEESPTINIPLPDSDEFIPGEVEQISGPTNISFGRPDDQSWPVTVPIPATSSDAVSWTIRTQFRSRKDNQLYPAECKILASVGNGVFEQRSLFLGSVRLSESTELSRTFELKSAAGKRVGNTFEGMESGETLQVELNNGDSALVRVNLSENSPTGLRHWVLVAQDLSHRDVRVPIQALVLP